MVEPECKPNEPIHLCIGSQLAPNPVILVYAHLNLLVLSFSTKEDYCC
jgi:hypothetical protein